MRESMTRASSTGDSLRLRKRRAISWMEAKAKSVSVIGGTVASETGKEFNTERTESTEDTEKRLLEDFFLTAQVTETADVGDDEGCGKAILGAYCAEDDPAILECQAAAVSVVADLHQLALQGLVGEVVANAGGEIESFAR